MIWKQDLAFGVTEENLSFAKCPVSSQRVIAKKNSWVLTFGVFFLWGPQKTPFCRIFPYPCPALVVMAVTVALS